METILQHAQGLVYSLLCLMPSAYQKASLKALWAGYANDFTQTAFTLSGVAG